MSNNTINWGAQRPEIEHFIAQHDLPENFSSLVERFYLPFAEKITDMVHDLTVLGVNGAQGTGKSTFSALLAILLKQADIRTAVLSIDDFYLRKSERELLAKDVHPLLATRGVPGTHDIGLALKTLQDLVEVKIGETVAVPRFDKARDDRCDTADYGQIEGPVDLIILEGWCVGASPELDAELMDPINWLEEAKDPNGLWRRYVNEQLCGDYQSLFSMIDCLVMLKAPSFKAIEQWRWQQEQLLIKHANGKGEGLMNEAEVKTFIQYFQRLTQHCLNELPSRADYVYSLNEKHLIEAVTGPLSQEMSK